MHVSDVRSARHVLNCSSLCCWKAFPIKRLHTSLQWRWAIQINSGRFWRWTLPVVPFVDQTGAGVGLYRLRFGAQAQRNTGLSDWALDGIMSTILSPSLLFTFIHTKNKNQYNNCGCLYFIILLITIQYVQFFTPWHLCSWQHFY